MYLLSDMIKREKLTKSFLFVQSETRGEHMTSSGHKSVLYTNHLKEQQETNYDFTNVTLANDDRDRRDHKVILVC